MISMLYILSPPLAPYGVFDYKILFSPLETSSPKRNFLIFVKECSSQPVGSHRSRQFAVMLFDHLSRVTHLFG
jgi:hypothetical protein